MSEYTDYFCVRVADPAAIVPALDAARIRAVVFDAVVATEVRPAWVAVACPEADPRAALLALGPTIQVRVDEDRIGWQLSVAGAMPVVLTFFDRPFWYRDQVGHAPDGFYPVAPRPLTGDDRALLTATFGLAWEELEPFLRAGGVEAFSKATGVPFLEMLDQYLLSRFGRDAPEGVFAISVAQMG